MMFNYSEEEMRYYGTSVNGVEEARKHLKIVDSHRNDLEQFDQDLSAYHALSESAKNALEMMCECGEID